jgi:hypothetical protein
MGKQQKQQVQTKGQQPTKRKQQDLKNPDTRLSPDKELQFREQHLLARLDPRPLHAEAGGLTATDLAPDFGRDFIIEIKNFLSIAECRALMEIIDRVGLFEANDKDKHPGRGEAFLDRENCSFTDESLSRLVWGRLEPLLPRVEGRAASGLHPALRYYIYRRGQRFTRHVDTSVLGAGGDTRSKYNYK